MCLQNLVKIEVDAKHQHELPSAKWSGPLNNKLSLYTCDPTALKQLRNQMNMINGTKSCLLDPSGRLGILESIGKLIIRSPNSKTMDSNWCEQRQLG